MSQNKLNLAQNGYFCQFLQFFRETDGLSISNPYTLLISMIFWIFWDCSVFIVTPAKERKSTTVRIISLTFKGLVSRIKIIPLSRQAIPREERGLCREPRRPLPHPPSPSAQEVPVRLPGRRGTPLGEDPAGGQVREARRRRGLPAHQHRDSRIRGREPHLRRGQCRLLRRLLGFELGQCRTVDQVSLKLKFKLFKV